MTGRPRVAVFKMTGCAGCQMELLRVFEDFAPLLDKLSFVFFKMAASECSAGPYDLSLIEGSVSTPRELREVKRIRERSRTVVAFGDCAVAGCVPSIRNWMDQRAAEERVYQNPSVIDSMRLRGVGEYIKTDHNIPGCPPDRGLIAGFLIGQLLGVRAYHRPHSVCVECRLKEDTCLLTELREPCMGPVTRAGCGAICPSGGRVCEGCYGPMNDPNPRRLAEAFRERGLGEDAIVRKFRKYAGMTEEFSGEAGRK